MTSGRLILTVISSLIIKEKKKSMITSNSVHTVINSLIRQGKSFSAFDVTKSLRNILGKSAQVDHSIVRGIVHNYMNNSKGYTVSSNTVGAVTYKYYSPLVAPVGNTSKPNSNKVGVTTSASTPSKSPTWVSLDAVEDKDSNTVVLSKKSLIPTVGTDSMNRLVLSKTMLRKHGFKPGTKVRVSKFGNDVVMEFNTLSKPTHTVSLSRGYLRVFMGSKNTYSLFVNSNSITARCL